MKHATSVALYEQWKRMRGPDRQVPRTALQPRDFGPLLPELFLIETDLSKAVPFRFCGASIARRYGRDLDGDSFLSLWQGDDRSLMRRNLSLLELRGEGIVVGIVAETAGAGRMAFEMLLLPLHGPDGSDAAIGSMARTGGHDENNRIRSRILSQEVRSFRFLGEQRPVSLATSDQTADFAGRSGAASLPMGPSDRRSRHSASRPNLTLVVGGK